VNRPYQENRLYEEILEQAGEASSDEDIIFRSSIEKLEGEALLHFIEDILVENV
jgi:hypothetical protein